MSYLNQETFQDAAFGINTVCTVLLVCNTITEFNYNYVRKEFVWQIKNILVGYSNYGIWQNLLWELGKSYAIMIL